MSDSNRKQMLDKILLAYKEGEWEDAIVNATHGAISGSIGLVVQEICRESSSEAPRKTRDLPYASGIIGLNVGEIVGNICLMFSRGAISEMAKIVYGVEGGEIDKAALDCVGEMTNLVHGLFKRKVNEKGQLLQISLPNVVLGEHQVVSLVATKYFRAEFEVAGHRVDVSLTIDLGS
jgi:CheY-specific phosphatase CheX